MPLSASGPFLNLTDHFTLFVHQGGQISEDIIDTNNVRLHNTKINRQQYVKKSWDWYIKVESLPLVVSSLSPSVRPAVCCPLSQHTAATEWHDYTSVRNMVTCALCVCVCVGAWV